MKIIIIFLLTLSTANAQTDSVSPPLPKTSYGWKTDGHIYQFKGSAFGKTQCQTYYLYFTTDPEDKCALKQLMRVHLGIIRGNALDFVTKSQVWRRRNEQTECTVNDVCVESPCSNEKRVFTAMEFIKYLWPDIETN